MKEFKIIKGKKIHPYVGGVKRSKKKAKVLSIRDSFVPPYKLGLMEDIVDERDFTLETVKIDKVLSSSSIMDYTSEMSPAKNQGALGSCVAFAAASMKEWQEKREHDTEVKEGKRDHRKGKVYDYSEAWIYWNCKKIDGYSGEGTYLRTAMQVLNKIGVPTEKAWPYSDDKLNIGEPKRWASLISKWALIGNYYRVNSVADAKIALADNGPFMMGIPLFYGFFFVGKDGVVKDPADGEKSYGGHALCVVGYDDERKLIKFKNSWGTNWGQSGYGYISYNYFNKYSQSNWACKDISVTKEMMKEARSL